MSAFGSFFFPGCTPEQRDDWFNRRMPEEDREPPEDQSCRWGTIGLMGGQVTIEVGLVTGSERIPGLGANAANLDEIKEILTDTSAQDMRRTVRTILRFVYRSRMWT